MAGWFTFVPEYIVSKNGKTIVNSFGNDIHKYIYAIPLRDYFNNNDGFYKAVDFDNDAISKESLSLFSYSKSSFYGKKNLKFVNCFAISYQSGKKFSISLPDTYEKSLESYLSYLDDSFKVLKDNITTKYSHYCFSINKKDFFENEIFEFLEARCIGKFTKEKGILVSKEDTKEEYIKIDEQILSILKKSGYSEDSKLNIIDSQKLAKGLKDFCIEQNLGMNKFFELINFFIGNLYELDKSKDYIQIDFGVIGEDVKYRISTKLKGNPQRTDYFLNNKIDGYIGYLMPKNWKDLVSWDSCAKILKIDDIDSIIDELTISIEKSKKELDLNNEIKELNTLLKKQTNVNDDTLCLYHNLITDWIEEKDYLSEDIETMESTLEEFKLLKTLLLRDLDNYTYDSARIVFSLSD